MPDDREQRYLAMISQFPDSPLGHFSLGRFHLEAGRFAQAAASLARCTGLDPTYAAALLSLGDAYAGAGETEKAKACRVELPLYGPSTFGAGILFFPISYLFDDILTEVYGYARSRKMVWAGFGALLFAAFMSWAIVHLPPSPGFADQEAYARIFG